MLFKKWTSGNKIQFALNANIDWEKWGKEDQQNLEKAEMYQKKCVDNKRKRKKKLEKGTCRKKNLNVLISLKENIIDY